MAKLYLVGTPIGNLGDITLRAIEILNKVQIIACEDTRHSLALLNKYQIKSKLVAYHKFNETECSAKLIKAIEDGNDVALITDAGMPCISDPGAILVEKCRENGVEVESVPGPTAFATAIALSGVQNSGFTFLGFLPEKKKERASLLQTFARSALPIVIYVAPHDLSKTAEDLLQILGDRKVYAVREITKMHESVTVTSLADFQCEERGEFVLIIDGATPKRDFEELSIEEHLKTYLSQGIDRKDAVKRVANERGVPKNEVYQVALTID